MKKALHLVTDEKFIDGMIEMMDSIDGVASSYATLNHQPFKFIKSDKVEEISGDVFRQKCIDSAEYDYVFLHSFSSLPYDLIHRIHPSIKVIWFSFGYDVYSNHWPEYKLIPINNRIDDFKSKILYLYGRNWSPYALLGMTKQIIKYGTNVRKRFRNAVKRVDYYSGVFPEEYDLAKCNLDFRAKPFSFNYTAPAAVYPFHETDIESEIPVKNGSILIGNSATTLLNHVSTLELLYRQGINDRQLILPLSYSGTKKYVNYVLKTAHKLFPGLVVPLIDFVPYDEYNNLISSASIAIFNIKQQASVGNILLALWAGQKVYFPKESMNFRHFTDIGMRVYGIEDELTEENIAIPLNKEDIQNNRRAIIAHYSIPEVHKRILTSFNMITIE